LNPYRYCGNDPLNAVDPSGLQREFSGTGGSAQSSASSGLSPVNITDPYGISAPFPGAFDSSFPFNPRSIEVSDRSEARTDIAGVKYHVQRDWTGETIGVTDEFGGPGYLTMDKYTGDVEFHPSGAITPEEPSSLQIWLGLPAAFVGGQAVSSLAASWKAVATTLKVGGVLTTGAMAYTTEEYVRAAYVSAQAGDKASMWENIEDAVLASVATIATAYGTYRAFAVGDGSTVQTPGSPRGSVTRLVVTDSRGNVVGEVPLVTARTPGGNPYAKLADHPSVGSGKKFTGTQKANIYQENMTRNEGVLRSDLNGEELVMPSKSVKGVTPPTNEAQIDHIIPRKPADPNVTPGSNSYGNAQVLSRKQNRLKSNRE
jgi:hypothetical protein